MRIYTAISRLLDYPNQELMDNLEDISLLVKDEPVLSALDCSEVIKVIDWMADQKLLELQEKYVATFDHGQETSLHLTHHLFGEEDRERGPAMINLGEHYKKAGLQSVKGELPDYLPLILEYISTLNDGEAGPFLGDAAEGITILADNLDKEKSPYAALVRVLERHGQPYRKAA
ncbi:MAG: nitrate reductase molybdenum cofactor assembly chaperone [Proteobacteria bacterium]|nr:nitrate reductase molybdenum cofactor assembly chaperone [Pseudomonadota bacterium]